MRNTHRLHTLALKAIAATILVLMLANGRADEQKATVKQRVFASPEEATKALLAATKDHNYAALEEIFGPEFQELLTGDKVQDENAMEAFAKAMAHLCNPVPAGEHKIILNIGGQDWPFPIPLVQKDGQWSFDTAAGKEEIINRHIGDGELHAIAVCRMYVDAQRQYAAADRDGSGVLKYAQKIKSTPGKQDGLYWEAAPGSEPSPFGALIAEAHEEGYGKNGKAGHTPPPHPFHGYIFRVLTRQGPAAPGGKYDYIINGNLIAGFALVAYPVRWGQSGIMTFLVNQQGKVYQRNLGEKTEEAASAMTEFNPDSHWSLVQDPGFAGP